MDPKEKALLEEALRLSKENNKILRKLQRAMKVSRAFTVIYWVIIIGSMLGLYYYFQPVIESMTGAYKSVMSVFGKGGNVVPSIPMTDTFLKN